MSGEEQPVELPGSFASPRKDNNGEKTVQSPEPSSAEGGNRSNERASSWKQRIEEDTKLDSRPLRERFEPQDSPKERPPKEEITLETRPNREREDPLPPPNPTEHGSGSSPSDGGALAIPQGDDGQMQVYSQNDPDATPRSQTSQQIVLSGFDWVVRFYCKQLSRFPYLFFLFWGVILVIVLATSWEEVVVDTNLNTFLEADSNASAQYGAFLQALKHRRSQGGQKVLDTSKLDFELHLLYQAKEVNTDKAGRDASSGILSEAALRDIRNFEQNLRDLHGWKQLCGMTIGEHRQRCEVGESLSNYAWPTRDDDGSSWNTYKPDSFMFGLSFDGLGKERLPNQATLAYLHTNGAELHDLQKFFPRDFDRNAAAADVMRSHFTFSAPADKKDEFKEKYEEFIVKDLYPLLVKQNDVKLGDYGFIRVFFAGDIIDGHEVRSTLASDAFYNIGAVIFAFLAAWLNTESLFLGTIATLATFTSIPMAHVMVPTVKTSIASFISVFLMVGIGSDIIFYFTDLWRKAGDRFADQPQVDRIYWAYGQCLLNCVPVVFTAASFFANLASVLRPLREFGLFMGACMLSSCLISLLVYFPALIMHTNIVRPAFHGKTFRGKTVPRPIAMIFEPKVEMKPSLVERLLSECMRLVQTGKNARWIIASVAILSVIFTIAAATTSKGGGRLPEIFPPNHNRHEGRRLLAGFAPTEPSVNNTVLDKSVCLPTTLDTPLCSLHWCEAPVTSVTEGKCECYGKPPKVELKYCKNIEVHAKIVGQSSLNATFLYDHWLPYIAGTFGASDYIEYWKFSSNETDMLKSVVLEHWESGEVHVEPFVQLPVTYGYQEVFNGKDCVENYMCFCGSRACQVENHWPTGKFEGFVGRRLQSVVDDEWPLSVGRALSSVQDEVPAHLRTEVSVVFGLAIEESPFLDTGSVMWSYDKASFEPSSPWAQRALREMCTSVPDNLKIREMKCWVLDFRLWLKARGQPFPTRRFGNFHDDVARFMLETADPPSEVWFEDGKLKATAFTFKVGVNRNLRAEDMLAYRDEWDAYVDGRNDKASVTANAAWHTSPTWVRAESEVMIMQSSTHVVGIAVALGVIGVFIYTMDLILTAFVMMQVMVIMAGLCFVMFVILGWSVGPLEVISLVVFVAYTVTPALHIARRFFYTSEEGRKLATMALADQADADAPEPDSSAMSMEVQQSSGIEQADTRQERTRNALMLSGSIALSCFMKTLFCSMWLLPATLWMFAKLGTVIFVVNLLSVGLTLIVFPALCVQVGPKSDAPTLVLLYRKIEQQVQRFRAESAESS